MRGRGATRTPALFHFLDKRPKVCVAGEKSEERTPLTRRMTAYVAHEHTTTTDQYVTIDLHVLWEPGTQASLLHDLVDSAVNELREQVNQLAA